jgi:hypothetical protein
MSPAASKPGYPSIEKGAKQVDVMQMSFLKAASYATVTCIALGWGESRAVVTFTPAGDGHVTVPAFVDGKGPFPFILDTGADGTGLYRWFAATRHFQAGKMSEVAGQTGTTLSPSYAFKTLSIDGHSIRNVIADGLPDRHDAGVEAGVAGNDLMDGRVAIFDFPCHTIELRRKPVELSALLGKQGIVIAAGTLEDGTQLTLPVSIGDVAGIAILDTGSRDTRISPSFAKAAGIDPSSPQFHDADLVYGANSKPMQSRQGPIGSVSFAGVVVPNAEARVMDLPVFRTFRVDDPNVMILGSDLMAGYRLVYDHEARRFSFTHSHCARP